MLCAHCHHSLDECDKSPAHSRLPHAALGGSYVVLPQRNTVQPQLSQDLGRSDAILQATSMHEQLRTVGRILELSEGCDPLECGVPLCEECASSVLRELQRQLEEVHWEREMLQAVLQSPTPAEGCSHLFVASTVSTAGA